jgi:hypothetical protein
MRRLISTLRDERVRFVGFVAGLGALLAVFGAFVLPQTARTPLPDPSPGEASRTAVLASNEQDDDHGCPGNDRSSSTIEVATPA